MAATCSAPLSLSFSGGSHLHRNLKAAAPIKSVSLGKSLQTKSNRLRTNRNFSVRSEYRDDGNRGGGGGGGGGDFVAGFLLGGALFGTLAYVFAPQIRRSLLNEDEYGFRKARKPIYYDEGLERTRQTLNEKISQLNSAIDNVSSRLRGGNNSPPQVPVETDPEVEATI